MSIRERIIHKSLREQFADALRTNCASSINVSNQTNFLIAELLHKYVYREPDEPASSASVHATYWDGSRGAAFPLRCLLKRNKSYEPKLRNVKPLRVAMISMRHQELDPLVDMAWLLNCDISQKQPLAAVEQFSYLQTRQQLREGLHSGALKLHFYQTGYQPVVIGFYRAVIDEFLARMSQPPVLEVIPYYYYFSMGCYSPGLPWN